MCTVRRKPYRFTPAQFQIVLAITSYYINLIKNKDFKNKYSFIYEFYSFEKFKIIMNCKL